MIILRSDKGSNLTPTEVDDNFSQLLARIVTLETTPPTAVSIASMSVTGNQLTVTLTDASTLGPFTIPTSVWKPKGAWLPTTIYLAFDTVTNDGSLYLVLQNHTSDLTFDPMADHGTGFLYALILAPSSQPNDIHAFVSGVLGNAQLILRTQATRSWIIPIHATGSLFASGVAAVATTVIKLQQNGADIGTLTWAAAGTVPAVVFAAEITFDVGDFFSIVGPAIADTGLADISFDILGTRA